MTDDTHIPPPHDILSRDALALSGALARRDVGAEEVMRATLDRIASVNPQINGIVSLRPEDELLAEARAADRTDRRGWLHGIPIAIKDLAAARGLPTSKGSPLLRDAIAKRDDRFVARLRAAGAIIIGKTNTPEFGLGSHTFNPVHGATRNPYDPGRSAGGSSGGAAAALAARILCVADGSDMMGSLRNPAAWNNVYGLRPSWGHIAPEPEGDLFLNQLSTIGPMARSPRDLAALLDTMAGPAPDHPLAQYRGETATALDGDVAGLRLGWLGDWGGSLPMAPGLLDFCAGAMRQFAQLGCDLEECAPPFDMDAIWDSWITLRSFAVATGLEGFFDDPARRDLLKPEARWEIERGKSFDAMTLHRASVIRSDWFKAAMQAFDKVDVLVLPAAQVWPFDVDMDYPREIAGQQMDTYHRWMQVVVPASLIGLPALAIPAGFGPEGLPMGLQLIGKPGDDAKLLRLAARWHEMTNWPDRQPPPL